MRFSVLLLAACGTTSLDDEIPSDSVPVTEDDPREVEEEEVTCTAFLVYEDLDGDGYGSAVSMETCEAIAGWVDVDGDCDDHDATLDPTTEWYTDADGDGYGTGQPTESCVAPEGTTRTTGDCDDTHATVSPSAPESCDGIDNNCSGDESDATDFVAFLVDADGDGFGDSTPVWACTPPAGSVGNGLDCDDTTAATHPLAHETCADGFDQDCTGRADNGCDVRDLGSEDTRSAGSDGFGFEVVAGGDLDGDGVADLLASAPWTDGKFVDQGEVLVFSGATGSGGYDVLGMEVIAIEGDSDYERLGVQAAITDLDGDGQDDLVLTSYRGGAMKGKAYTFTGPLDGSLSVADADGDLRGLLAAEVVGSELAVGDMDGDGEQDFLLGAPGANGGGGAVYLVLGPMVTNLTTDEATATLTESAKADGPLGAAVVMADGDGDGVNEALVGAPALDGDLGGVLVFATPPSGAVDETDADVVLLGWADLRAGSVLEAPGDIDGDGNVDLFVGGEGLGSEPGALALVPGPWSTSGDIDDLAPAAIKAETEMLFPVGVAFHDGDGDGALDLLAQGSALPDATTSTTGSYDTGTALHLFYGPLDVPRWAEAADVAWSHETLDGVGPVELGHDVDGDGSGDLLLGVPLSDTTLAILSSTL